MKILLYYFSGTGNTKKIAELYGAAFSAADEQNKVTLRELDCNSPPPDDALSFDMIGIGYPIHAFNAPQIILKLCKALPNAKKSASKPHVFIFKSSGEPVRMSDVSSLKMRAILKRRGYVVKNEYQYIMPYNIIFRHSDGAAYKMWTTAQKLVPIDVDEILSGKPHLPKKLFMGGFLAWVLRVEHGGAHILGRSFKAGKACVNCKMCVKNCPANNIKIKKNGKIKFGGKCMLCMRCVFFCPTNAIKTGILKPWNVNGAYSFKEPTEPEPKTKHDKYCAKAYARYYAEAEQKIRNYELKIKNY